jgi:membrane-bound serine protease (ClpP class)
MKRSLVLVLLLCAAFLSAWGCVRSGGGDEAGEVYVARLDGEVNGRAARHLTRVISEAEEAEAAAVVIEIDTPGGRLDHTKTIVEAQSNAQGLPVIAYVSPQGARAASAGTFIVMASDVAAMAPQTTIGAAAPVDLFGRDLPGVLGDKVTNDSVSLITGLAQTHGRNQQWAESAVREAASANAEEALEIGVVEYVESDLETVLEEADGERVEPKGIVLETAGAAIVAEGPTFRERFGIPLYAVVIPAVLAVLAVGGLLITVIRTSRWRVSTGKEGMIGEVGVVRRAIEGSTGGAVFVHGELWSALPERAGEVFPAGSEVEVVGFRRTALLVRRAGGDSQGL